MILIKFSNKVNIEKFLAQLKEKGYIFHTIYKYKKETLRSAVFPRFSKFLFLIGLVVFILVVFFQYLIKVSLYPQNFGGKPNFHWSVALPIAFEISMLLVGLLALSRFFLLLRHQYSVIPNNVLQILQSFNDFFVLIFIDSDDLVQIQNNIRKCFEDTSNIEVKIF